jgi:hypothetical protein
VITENQAELSKRDSIAKVNFFPVGYRAMLTQKCSFVSDETDSVRQAFEVIIHKHASGLGMSLVGGGQHGKLYDYPPPLQNLHRSTLFLLIFS